MTPFRLNSLPATPWKNGGGSTREIACLPAGAGLDDFAWRASVARIASDGPFSVFDGVDRVITLLAGGGVRLRDADGSIDHRLDEPLEPFAFPGDASVASVLLDGECEDFNVMVRRSRASADVRVLRDAARVDAAGAGLIFAARGAWRARSESSTSDAASGARDAADERVLAAGDGVWWDGERAAWRVAPAEGDCALIAVRIARRDEGRS